MNSDKPQKKIVPAPLIVAFCIGGGFFVHHLRPVGLLPEFGVVTTVVGTALCLAGLAIGLAGVREFHRHNTPTNPFKPTSALVTSGVLRYTRNPMYLGFVVITIGIAIAVSSLALLVAAILEAALLQVAVIRPEERALSEAFGSDFEAYRQRTRSWI